ncbi:MAG: DUF7146 domain-containing protein [Beijerinckiaceae bacterium]
MTHPTDPRVAEARLKDIFEVADQLQIAGLSKAYGAGRAEKSGPCPSCGGRDRFSLNRKSGLFNCRHCGGGDVIRLVEKTRGIDFPAALDWLCGPKPVLTQAEVDQRLADAARQQAQRDADEARARARAVADAREVWDAAARFPTAPVAGYLECRGITLRRLPDCLRFAPDLPYAIQIDGKWREVHRGPAMLARISAPDGSFMGCHRTWFDLSAPQGKVKIAHPVTGEALARKKTLGSVKGNAIRLTGRHFSPSLVMGEGSETTFSAGMSKALPDAMFWAGVSLGNMGGSRETGKGLKFAGIPRMDDDRAFLPPPWVTDLTFLMDGDSEPRNTRATLQAGLRRAMAMRRRDGGAPLRARIAAAPTGMDFNDVLLEGAQVEDEG